MASLSPEGSGNLQEPIGNLCLGNWIFPPALTANTDNYDPTDLQNTSVIVLTDNGGGPYNLTGLVAQAAGKIIALVNNSAESIILKHNDGSTLANRFFGPNSSDVTLRTNGWVFVIYDTTTQKWRIMGA